MNYQEREEKNSSSSFSRGSSDLLTSFGSCSTHFLEDIDGQNILEGPTKVICLFYDYLMAGIIVLGLSHFFRKGNFLMSKINF